MAISQKQKDAAELIEALYREKGIKTERKGGPLNIILYVGSTGSRRFVIMPRGIRKEESYMIPATSYSSAEKQWALIRSYSTTDFSNEFHKKEGK